MSYSHLLIPTDFNYVPPVDGLISFLGLIEALGVIPDPWDMWVLDRARSSTFQTPTFTIRVPGKKIPIDSVADVETTLHDVHDFDLRASGDGIPRRLLMPLQGVTLDLTDMRETLHVAVACHVRPQPVGMSDLHAPDDALMGGFLPCPAQDRPAFFTHPETRQVFEVPHAGAARFWISVHIGNGIRPVFADQGFALIPDPIVCEFGGVLGVELVQGGTWAEAVAF